jgi:diacylglycerol kinase
MSILVILLAFWLSLGRLEWAVLILTIALVWMAEFFNTALEILVNLVSPQPHSLAKACKDVSAAAVLITAFISVLIGFIILGPPLWKKLIGFF